NWTIWFRPSFFTPAEISRHGATRKNSEDLTACFRDSSFSEFGYPSITGAAQTRAPRIRI
ncbi:MAG: hypothetical protein AAFV87_15065, partial [Pseudomonadota bacterium]